jgi:hypothetical protein
MNKNHFCILFMLLTFTTVILQACDTKDDSVIPEISVIEPSSGKTYENGDTISVYAVFSDNVQLNTVEFSLVDRDNKPMLPTISLVPGQNPFTLQGDYIIDDPMLPGGTYQLRFRASDGVNVTNHFVGIQIHELERHMLYPIIVTHPEPGKWLAYRLTNNGEWMEFCTHTGDYSGSAVNSPASLFYMCGIIQSDLTAIKLPGGATVWSVKPRFHQSQRWFEGITFSYPNLYVSCAEGNIRAYNETGNEIYKSETYTNAFPRLSVLTKNFVISSFKDAFSNNKFLIAFHNTGGAMIYNRFVQTDVACLLHTGSDKVLVLGNSSGQGEISLYNGADNSLVPLHSFYEGTFYKAVAMDNDNYMISTSAGLYRYQLSINSLTPFALKAINGNIACDNNAQVVYAATGKMLEVYDFPGASLVESYPLPDTALDLHLVFNK